MSTGVQSMKSEGPDVERYNWVTDTDVVPHGYSVDVSDKYFGEDTPHEPPVVDVDLKLAADIEIISDEEFAKEVAEWWFPGETEKYIEVAAIIFNDGSIWYIPLASWDNDYEKTRMRIVDDYMSDVVQWKALVRGDNPREALEDWYDWKEPDKVEWLEDMDKTEMSEEQRKWFNENVDWLEHIDRTVESSSSDVELELEDDDWTDDW